VGLLATGCASLTREATGPIPAGPAAGMARVYFALPQGFPGGAAYVVENEKLLGYVRNEDYFYVDVPAGEHLFMLISEGTEGVAGQWEGGKTYHMKLYITPGIWSNRVHWTPLEAAGKDAALRKEDLADCDRRVELVPQEAAEWEADEAQDNRDRVQDFATGDEKATPILPQHGL
jgi:hypothetical protein